MPDQAGKAEVKFAGASPMDLSGFAEPPLMDLNEAQQITLEAVGTTVRAYIKEAAELLQGRYAQFRDLAPSYLSIPGNVLACCCPDGVAIRFEKRTNESRVIAAWSDEPLVQLVPMLSQNVIGCYADRASAANAQTSGILINLYKESSGAKAKEDLASIRIAFDAVIERPEFLPAPPAKPFCLLSVRNDLEIQLILRPVQHTRMPDERVMVRNPARLPVGWECIEVYPFFEVGQWRPEYASVWALNDILASVVAHQSKDLQYASLDPNASARRKLGALLTEYKDLLDSDPEREETLQKFLCDNPALLCPAHDWVAPKVALGSRKTDFVFREAVGDYLLVELERSTHRLFLKDGHTSRELEHARGQIIDWKRYLEDNLNTVQREVGLAGISTNPKALIVIGRSSSLTAENRRKLVSIENDSPKLKIMTYDDVHDNAKAVIQNLLGPIWSFGGNTQVYYLPGKQL